MNIRGIVLMRDLLLLAIHRKLQGRCLSDPRNTLTHTAAERQSSPNTVSRVDQLQSRRSQPDRAILDCGLGGCWPWSPDVQTPDSLANASGAAREIRTRSAVPRPSRDSTCMWP